MVREELSRNRLASSTNLYSRTQDLIGAATHDVASFSSSAINRPSSSRSCGNSPSTNTNSNNSQSTDSRQLFPITAEDVWGHPSRGRKRSVPGHPGGFHSTKKTRGGSSAKPKTVTVILFPKDLDNRETYKVDQNDELLTGYTEIHPEYTEKAIRSELTNI